MTLTLSQAAQNWAPDSDNLSQRRQQALQALETLGLPGKRSEAWRYTPTDALHQDNWETLGTHSVTRESAAASIPSNITGCKLFFVNGVFQADWSDTAPANVTIVPLAEAAQNANYAEHIGRLSANALAHEGEGMVALNQSALNHGVLIHATATTDTPLVLIHVGSGQNWTGFGRQVIIAEDNVELTLHECHNSHTANCAGLLNNVTEIIAKPHANVIHSLVDNSSYKQWQIHYTFAEIHASANVHGHRALLGGEMIRSSMQPCIIGTKATCEVDGFYLADAGQTFDNHMRMDHKAPDCWSRQTFKGIAQNGGRGIFTGRVVVDQLAQQTDAVQSCKGMLLDNDSRLLARPQLEIYADDVKCTHGATTGQIDAQQLFYLQSRGIPRPLAKAYLIDAFAADVLHNFPEALYEWTLAITRDKLAAEYISD